MMDSQRLDGPTLAIDVSDDEHGIEQDNDVLPVLPSQS